MMGLAERQRVLVAAGSVPTNHPREAAIVGGIVRSAIDIGHIDMVYVSRYTQDVIQTFDLVNVDSRAPSAAEIAMVKSRFDECYRQSRPL